MRGGRRDTDGGTTDLPVAMCAQRRAEQVEGVDEDEGCLERAVRAIQVELDGLVADGIQGHEGRRRLGREVGIEPAGHQHDPALEQLLLQPGGEPTPTGRLRDVARHAHSLSVYHASPWWSLAHSRDKRGRSLGDQTWPARRPITRKDGSPLKSIAELVRS